MEAIFSGREVRLIEVRRPEPIKTLTEKQLEWCRQKWPWLEHPRVIRLAERTGEK